MKKSNPEFISWAKDINTFNKNQLQNMVDAGLTSEESQQYLNETYDNYVRIQREVTGGTAPVSSFNGNVKLKNPIQKAKGGNQNILPLEDSMAAQTIMVRNAIRRNDLGLELLKSLGGEINVEYDPKNIVNKTENGDYSVTVFKDGNPIKVPIDEGIYNALSNDLKNQIKGIEEKLSLITKPLQAASKVQRGLLTSWSPVFTATNFLKTLEMEHLTLNIQVNLLKTMFVQ